MSANQFKDQLFPLREELMKKQLSVEKEKSKQVIQTTSKKESPKHVEPTSTYMETHTTQVDYTKEKEWEEYDVNRAAKEQESNRRIDERYQEDQQRISDWQERRRQPQESFQSEYELYKIKQKKNDEERQAFNDKYTAKNKEIADDLKRLRLAESTSQDEQKGNKRLASTLTPTTSPKKPFETPTKSPPRQKFKGASASTPESTTQDVVAISYSDLIQHMGTTGMKLTNLLQKEELLQFVCKKRNITVEHLSSTELSQLQQSISKFFNTLTSKYKEPKISRNVSRLLQSKWSANELVLPSSMKDHSSKTPKKLSAEDDELSKVKKRAFTQDEMYNVMKENKSSDFTSTPNQVVALKHYILTQLELVPEDIGNTEKDLDESLRMFVVNASTAYTKSHRMFEKFKQKLMKKENWQNVTFELPQSFQNKVQQINTEKSTKITTSYSGPIQRMPPVMKPFAEKSKRSQQYASAAVRQSHEPEAITLAASQQPTPLGLLIKRTNTVRGISVEKALNAVDNQLKSAEPFERKTPEEALGHILSNHLTKDQYLSMKTASALSSANIWPNYNKVLKAKAQCRPDGIVINELNASVPIQNLLDHTTRRILLSDDAVVEKMKELADKNNGNLEIQLYFKFGFDGCGSFNTNMQKDTTGKVPDATALVTSQLVPLQAVVLGKEKLIIHNNTMPNNANACRPIRLSYEKESQDNI